MKTFFVLLISLIFYIPLYAQDAPRELKYALSFGIDSNFKLDKFIMDIAGKKILNNNDQVRLFISPRISSRNSEQISYFDKEKNEYLFYSFGIGSDYLWELMRYEDVAMFGGTGLKFTYGRHKKTGSTVNEYNNKSFNETVTHLFDTGIRGVIGVEWKVSKKIGIHSEYLLSGDYYIHNEEQIYALNEYYGNRTYKRKGIELNSYVYFGLSIYL